MGRAFWCRPKSIVLIVLLLHHAGPLAYDWRVRFGADVRADLERIGWARTWELARQILADPYSHTVSSLRADKYVPSPAEVANHRLTEFIRQILRGKNQVVKASRGPWEGAQLSGAQPRQLTDEQRAEHRDELLALTGVSG